MLSYDGPQFSLAAPECKKAINLFVDGLYKSSQYQLQAIYVLSFVTTSEIEVSSVTVVRSRPARNELIRARAVTKDTIADIVCFAEFFMLIFRAPMANGPNAVRSY
jgi:hypothetical protein